MLTGKVAIVTGGGQGVGLGIASAFAAAGANVVISGRSIEKLRDAAAAIAAVGRGRPAIETCVADVRDRADADRTILKAISTFGRLDVLVNNAQMSAPGISLEALDDDTMRATLESGLYGAIYHMQAALPHLKERGGSIINLGSREGIEGGKGFGIYAATKEAIRGVSRDW